LAITQGAYLSISDARRSAGKQQNVDTRSRRLSDNGKRRANSASAAWRYRAILAARQQAANHLSSICGGVNTRGARWHHWHNAQTMNGGCLYHNARVWRIGGTSNKRAASAWYRGAHHRGSARGARVIRRAAGVKRRLGVRRYSENNKRGVAMS